MSQFHRQPRFTDNFSQIPHGLWTADLTWGAKCLLGWLHSHDERYLSSLSNNRIRTELGASGSVSGWITELVGAGFIHVEKHGQRNRFVLLARPWERLACRVQKDDETVPAEKRPVPESLDQPAEKRPVSSRLPAGNQPKNGYIEEQREHQGEEQQTQTSDITQERVEDDDWLDFWRDYPRAEGKVAAQRAWRKMSAQDRADALATLPVHVLHWRARQIARTYIPHASTWLNGRRWEDDLGDPAEDMPLTKRIARFALEADKLNAGGQQ